MINPVMMGFETLVASCSIDSLAAIWAFEVVQLCTDRILSRVQAGNRRPVYHVLSHVDYPLVSPPPGSLAIRSPYLAVKEDSRFRRFRIRASAYVGEAAEWLRIGGGRT